MTEITFLGTQGMQPTKERGLPSIYMQFGEEHCLIDCGEGTQRQMRIAGLKPTKLTKIFISHVHADHILGIAGLLRNLEANSYQRSLEIFGPKGIDKYVQNMINASINPIQDVPIKVIEIKEGIIFENEEYKVEAKKLAHSVPSYGFAFTKKAKRKINIDYMKKVGLTQHPLLGDLQKGKDIEWEGKKILVTKATYLTEEQKLVFINDTGFDQSCIDLAKDADLLISESTFGEEEQEKAKEYKHLTATQAATIAKKAKAKRLILTHFSQRYKDTNQLLTEAKAVFKNVECAEDFLKVSI